MKNFISGLFIGLLVLAACAGGGKSYKKPERNMQDKMYESCRDSWVDGDATGKLCNRRCIKRSKSGKCKDSKFKTIVKNYCDTEIFKWFRAGSFIFIDEDQVL